MEEPIWILEAVVHALHAEQIAEHGGSHGIRDEGLLELALTRPQNLWHYGDPAPDLAALAASYATGVIRNHPFVDGNKRVGNVLCFLFLLLNGHDLEVRREEEYVMFYEVAAGDRSEEELSVWIRANLAERRL